VASDKSYLTEQRFSAFYGGFAHLVLASDVVINSTTPIAIFSFAVTPNAAAYRITGCITGQEGATTSQVAFQVNGPAFSHVAVNFTLYGGPPTGIAQTPFVEQVTTLNALGNAIPNGNNIPANGVFTVTVDGVLIGAPGGGGTVTLLGAENTTGDPWTALANRCWLDVIRQN
jgi:hypothetical protein